MAENKGRGPRGKLQKGMKGRDRNMDGVPDGMSPAQQRIYKAGLAALRPVAEQGRRVSARVMERTPAAGGRRSPRVAERGAPPQGTRMSARNVETSAEKYRQTMANRGNPRAAEGAAARKTAAAASANAKRTMSNRKSPRAVEGAAVQRARRTTRGY